MIQLSDEEKRHLEILFKFDSDQTLIRELVRRGRLRQVSASAGFYPEMRDDREYMDTIRGYARRQLAQSLDSDVVCETTHSIPEVTRSHLSLDIVLLAPPKKEEG